MNEVQIAIVNLSDSFGELWREIASDVGASEAVLLQPGDDAIPPELAAIVLAAGGAEFDALHWLEMHELRAGVPVFVVGADSARRTATQIVARGARDYFVLPEDLEILTNTLAAAVNARRDYLRGPNREAPSQSVAFQDIVGESDALQQVLTKAARIVPRTDATVLVCGETGTGKELLAHAIHRAGPRHSKPFVAVNCSALPDNLIESELFGHERGAFTGANAAKPGLFEVADGGTLFLDEIGTLLPELQSKLLRVLQDRMVRRVGGTKARKVDIRIIAATNDDLKTSIHAGRFREDLYYRIGVITLTLPALRQRNNDVVLIAKAALERLARQHKLSCPSMGADFQSRLLSYQWPGNVRELCNAIERALLLSPPGTLDADELGIEVVGTSPIEGSIPIVGSLDAMNAVAARATLELCSGNRSEAARRLAISRRRLRRLLVYGNGEVEFDDGEDGD